MPNHTARYVPLVLLLACTSVGADPPPVMFRGNREHTGVSTARSVAPVPADTVLLRRYLKAGGKIVNFSVPLGAVVRESTGAVLGDEPKRIEQLLGVSAGTLDYDEGSAAPTEQGRRWGIERSFRGDYPIAASAVTTPLALNRDGMATAWVQNYRRDRPGSGYVQLWGLGATIERLPDIRAAAEYGLLRKLASES